MFPEKLPHDKNNDSNPSFPQQLDNLVAKYNHLIQEAQRTALAQDGNPSKEEAAFYYQAGKICDEIMNPNQCQPAVFSQWQLRKLECEQNVQRIRNALCPRPVPQPQAVPTTSKTGFHSRNASRDLPVETIERWFVKETNLDFSDVAGYEKLRGFLQNELDSENLTEISDKLGINPVRKYFFYGLPGTGNDFLIGAFVGELMKKGFRCIRINSTYIHASLVGVAEKIIAAAFAEAMDHAPCVLYLEDIESICLNRDQFSERYERRLTVAFLEAFAKMEKAGKKVWLICSSSCPSRVDFAFLNHTTMVKVDLPDTETRMQFLRSRLSTVALEDGFTFAEMAADTQQYILSDLDRLIHNMLDAMKHLALETNRVVDPDGNLDWSATVQRALDGIRSGEIRLTRALFKAVKEESPLPDRSDYYQELRRFEEDYYGII